MSKFCIFCGKKPNNKNREHVLPQWLIKMTGDIKRIAPFGYDYANNRLIKFDWGNFVAPSCSSCNYRYEKLETKVKPLIEKLSNEEEITANEAIIILDWLDKVRIGLWLNYYYLEKNKAQIKPKFYIDDRIGKKDRLMQIHFLKSDKIKKGLNAYGVDSFAFQRNPSFIGLKINNLLILNASNDFAISENCGFPYPSKMKTQDNGMLMFSDIVYNRRTNPIINNLNLYKGVLTIMQPIHSIIPYNSNYFSDSYLIQHCIDITNKVGKLFRIKSSELESIHNLYSNLEFESILNEEAKYIGQLIAKIYEGQNLFLMKTINKNEPEWKNIIKYNEGRITFFNNYHKTKE